MGLANRKRHALTLSHRKNLAPHARRTRAWPTHKHQPGADERPHSVRREVSATRNRPTMRVARAGLRPSATHRHRTSAETRAHNFRRENPATRARSARALPKHGLRTSADARARTFRRENPATRSTHSRVAGARSPRAQRHVLTLSPRESRDSHSTYSRVADARTPRAQRHVLTVFSPRKSPRLMLDPRTFADAWSRPSAEPRAHNFATKIPLLASTRSRSTGAELAERRDLPSVEALAHSSSPRRFGGSRYANDALYVA